MVVKEVLTNIISHDLSKAIIYKKVFEYNLPLSSLHVCDNSLDEAQNILIVSPKSVRLT